MSRTVWVPERFHIGAQREVWPTKDGGITTDPSEALQFETRAGCLAWCDVNPSVWVPTEHVFEDAA